MYISLALRCCRILAIFWWFSEHCPNWKHLFGCAKKMQIVVFALAWETESGQNQHRMYSFRHHKPKQPPFPSSVLISLSEASPGEALSRLSSPAAALQHILISGDAPVPCTPCAQCLPQSYCHGLAVSCPHERGGGCCSYTGGGRCKPRKAHLFALFFYHKRATFGLALL